MSDTSLQQENIQFPAIQKPDRDFDLDEDEISDLDFLRGLYPELTSDQLLEVKERLDGYFDIALETFLEKQRQSSVDE